MLQQLFYNDWLLGKLQFLQPWTDLEPMAIARLLWTVALLTGWFLSHSVIKRLIAHRLNESSRRYVAIKSLHYLVGLAFLFVIFRLWYHGDVNIVTYLGILSAGLAIALQLPITNLAGWFYIIWKRPFFIGDRIEIGIFAGDVIDLGLFQFSLVEIGNWVDADQSTGRIVHVPNGKIFSEPVFNYTEGFQFIWDEIPVRVTYESDWRLAKDLLLEIGQRHAAIPSEDAIEQVRQAAQKYMVVFRKLTPIVWTSVNESGVTLTLRYLCAPRRRRSSQTRIWEDILTEFSEHRGRIAFAYNTQRFFYSPEEWRLRESTENGGKPKPVEGLFQRKDS